jgi:hypothetical protein
MTCTGPPVVLGSAVLPNPSYPGVPVTWTLAWSDPDSGDVVRVVVCMTPEIHGAACVHGTWAVGAFSSAAVATASYPAPTAMSWSEEYDAFACDQRDLCSAPVTGYFSVNPL